MERNNIEEIVKIYFQAVCDAYRLVYEKLIN